MAEPAPVWSGPGSGWNSAARATAGDKIGGKDGAAGADSVVKGSGGQGYGQFSTGNDEPDGDGDDAPTSNGTAAGHADVVPTGGAWPAIQK